MKMDSVGQVVSHYAATLLLVKWIETGRSCVLCCLMHVYRAQVALD
jgi:hypothetical protein